MSSPSSATYSAVITHPGHLNGVVTLSCGFWCVLIQHPVHPFHRHVSHDKFCNDLKKSREKADSVLREHNLKHKLTINDYQISPGDPSVVKIQLDKIPGRWVEVDERDRHMFSSYKLEWNHTVNRVLAINMQSGDGIKERQLARLLVGALPTAVVRFKDGNELNCRRSNLVVEHPDLEKTCRGGKTGIKGIAEYAVKDRNGVKGRGRFEVYAPPEKGAENKNKRKRQYFTYKTGDEEDRFKALHKAILARNGQIQADD